MTTGYYSFGEAAFGEFEDIPGGIVLPPAYVVPSSIYLDLLKFLLPPGRALPRQTGTVLDSLLHALAEEFARVDLRAIQALDEANPATTLELLQDWERVAGLPDPCVGVLAETIQGRRDALIAKLTQSYGQSRQFFINLAAAMGFTITITEHDVSFGSPLVYTWIVNADADATAVYFTAGDSAAGDYLLTINGNEALECAIRASAPAHTIVQFAYPP